MAAPQGDGWTVVSRRRGPATRGRYRSAPRPVQHPNPPACRKGVLTYADAVKSDTYERGPAYHKAFQQWSAGLRPSHPRVRPAPNDDRRAPRMGPRIRIHIGTEDPGPLNKKGTNYKQNSKAQQQSNPEFTETTKRLFRIIKLTHHKENVQDSHPPTIARLQHFLENIIKPAVPNSNTQTQITKNAETWANTTMNILRQHYDRVLEKEKEIIERLQVKHMDRLDDQFRVAIGWAKRSLGKRLREETIMEVYCFLRDWDGVGPSPIPSLVSSPRPHTPCYPLPDPTSENPLLDVQAVAPIDTNTESHFDDLSQSTDSPEPPVSPEYDPALTSQAQTLVHVTLEAQPCSPSPSPDLLDSQLQNPMTPEPPIDLMEVKTYTMSTQTPECPSTRACSQTIIPRPLGAKTIRTIPTTTTRPRETMADSHGDTPRHLPSSSAALRSLSPDKVLSLRRATQTRLDTLSVVPACSNIQREVQGGQPKRSLRLLNRGIEGRSGTPTPIFKARKALSFRD